MSKQSLRGVTMISLISPKTGIPSSTLQTTILSFLYSAPFTCTLRTLFVKNGGVNENSIRLV